MPEVYMITITETDKVIHLAVKTTLPPNLLTYAVAAVPNRLTFKGHHDLSMSFAEID